MAEAGQRDAIVRRIVAARQRRHGTSPARQQRPTDARRPRRLVVDPRPGRYYVTARDDAGRTAFVLGPFRRHQQARRFVQQARVAGERLDPWACFYAWGTARLGEDWPGVVPVGALNAALGIAVRR